MTYQEILLYHLEKRRRLNENYSLRAFSKYLKISASKLSEILNQKKGISLSRAKDICEKLNLSNDQKNIFLLSVQAQHSRKKIDKEKAKSALQFLLEKSSKIKSAQENAWYYGAVKKMLELGVKKNSELSKRIGVSKMQAENAKKYLTRLSELHAHVNELRFDSISVIKKIQSHIFEQGDGVFIKTDFCFITKSELQKLNSEIEKVILKFQKETQKENITPDHRNKELYLLNFTSMNIANEIKQKE